MNYTASELIEKDIVSEPEIVDLISSMSKLVKLGVLEQKKLNSICETLQIKQVSENTFEINDNNVYTFN